MDYVTSKHQLLRNTTNKMLAILKKNDEARSVLEALAPDYKVIRIPVI